MGCKRLRVGIFFDGTGNSRREKETFTNVAKLYDRYLTLEDEYYGKPKIKTTSFKCYCVGVGEGRRGEPLIQIESKRGRSSTANCRKDEGIIELAAGAGGAERIYAMIDALCQILDAHPYHSSDDTRFKFREIDIFGFSRGAALARDFVNTFIKNYVKEEPIYKDVCFNFIGLFDTVGSFGIPGNDIDMKPREEFHNEVSEGTNFYRGVFDHLVLNSNSLEHVDGEIVYKEIFKDRAKAQRRAEELRRYWRSVEIEPYSPPAAAPTLYPLYKVEAKDAANYIYEPYNFNLNALQAKKIVHLTAIDEVRKNFPLFNANSASEEIAMIGVHSDIGGGYGAKDAERLVMVVKDEKRTLLKRKLELGWRYMSRRNRDKIYKNRTVSNSLAKASFFLMYDKAIKYDALLQTPLTLSVEEELLRRYMKHISNGNDPILFQEREEVTEYLAHQSATHPTVGEYYNHPLRVSENSAEFIALSNIANINNGKVSRDIYKNEPSLAITPG